jgi:ectoine hydroxylase-related dioxygenase (phytanoyl-CoA dioxygenase family)
VISRKSGYLRLADEPAPEAAEHLQREGYVVLRGVFGPDEVEELAADILRVFADTPADIRYPGLEEGRWEPYRYEMFNRSAAAQRAIGQRAILDVIEPLLGEDCHVIANTAWYQPAAESDHGGRYWHIDAGPHIPRDPSIPWDERIPYPVFAVAAHLFLWDCPLESGPTGVIPRSHTSGQPPPSGTAGVDLEWDGHGVVPLVAEAGDVALFVSDVWHRRLPSGDGDPGRFFLQCHYGRRDLAQRLRTTEQVNHVAPEALARATSTRDRTLLGLHRPGFYDG